MICFKFYIQFTVNLINHCYAKKFPLYHTAPDGWPRDGWYTEFSYRIQEIRPRHGGGWWPFLCETFRAGVIQNEFRFS